MWPLQPSSIRCATRTIASGLIGGTISLLGDQFYLVALPWLVLQETGSAVAMGAIMMAGAIPRALLMLRTRLIACDGRSLHFGLSAPPTASQASVPGVAIETQLCSNDANVSGRTVAPTYST